MPPSRPLCCGASFAAMLFELAGPAASLLVGGSSETTTGVAAEVDVELWLLRACFDGSRKRPSSVCSVANPCRLGSCLGA